MILTIIMLMLCVVPVSAETNPESPAKEAQIQDLPSKVPALAGENFKSLAKDLKGRKIALLTGSSCEAVAKKYFTESEFVYYDTMADAFLALKTHKVDAYVENDSGLRYLNAVNNEARIVLSEEPAEHMSTMFVNSEKGRFLRNQYNEYIRKLKSSGELDALQAKWIFGTEDDRVLGDYQDLPDINGTLSISTEPSFVPFQYIKDGQLIGYEIEIVTGFCREYGYKPEFDLVSFSGSITGVFTGKYDMAASGLSITPERQKHALFGDVIYEGTIAAAVINEQSPVPSGSLFDQLRSEFESTFITESRWKMFASGIGVTLLITFASILFGSLIGFGVYMLTRKDNKIAEKAVGISRAVIQGFPMVVFLMILYYLVFGKSNLDAIWVCIIAFSATFACTVHTMLEHAESTIERGQFEAAYSLGYRENKALFRYILPQSLAYFLPDYRDEMITHLKMTAIVGYIAVIDVTKVGDIIRGRSYTAFVPLLAVSVSYFLIAFLIRKIMNIVIRRADPENRREKDILKGLVIR